ncbi:MAG: hypothetical protein AB9895_01960 [Negativicutes bacterium]
MTVNESVRWSVQNEFGGVGGAEADDGSVAKNVRALLHPAL